MSLPLHTELKTGRVLGQDLWQHWHRRDRHARAHASEYSACNTTKNESRTRRDFWMVGLPPEELLMCQNSSVIERDKRVWKVLQGLSRWQETSGFACDLSWLLFLTIVGNGTWRLKKKRIFSVQSDKIVEFCGKVKLAREKCFWIVVLKTNIDNRWIEMNGFSIGCFILFFAVAVAVPWLSSFYPKYLV